MLELAKEPGNVAEAGPKRGLDRTLVSEWKRRVQTQGFEALTGLPPLHKSHPQARSLGHHQAGLSVQPDKLCERYFRVSGTLTLQFGREFR